jgi:NADPH:quinone reductase
MFPVRGTKETHMRAITVDDFGAPPTLSDQPLPKPGPGEVLVRVHAASVNGFDVSVAAGRLKGMMEHRFPVVLGKDFAGSVEGTGPDVATLAVGDAVFGTVMKPTLGDGSFAEYVTVAETFASKVPPGLDLVIAGALGLAGTAALQALDAIAPAPGEAVLVSGATGGVGGFVVQLAAARGAQVVGTARRGEEESHLRGLGVHHVVDYAGDVTAAVAALRPDGVHAIVHLAGDGPELAGLLVPGGRIASTLGLTGESLGNVDVPDVKATPVMAVPNTALLERLAAAVIAGDLTVPIQRTYSLAEVPQALADFAVGTRGKLAVTVE